MSQPSFFQRIGGSGTIIFLLFLGLGSAVFGYVVGSNDKDSYLQKNQQPIEQKQPNFAPQRR
jgi:hypothetical protein